MLRLELGCLVIVVATINLENAVFAQHSDIAINVANEQLTVNESLFLADFRVGLADNDGVLELRNPGYITERANQLLPNTWLGFEVVGPLLYSDGTGWRPAESTAFFEFFRPFVEGHSVVVSGQSTSQDGFELSQADERGFVHEHIWFRLGNSDAGEAPDGVYGVQQVLTSPTYDSSDPFLLIFNHGIETPDFIQSVVAARQLIVDGQFDCTDDGLLLSDDLACVSTIEQRDSVLRSIGSVAGDLNGDGSVEFSDFLILSQNFGSDETSYTKGNIDLVNGIDFPDFLVQSENFGHMDGAKFANVPETSGGYNLVLVLTLFAIYQSSKRTGRKYQETARVSAIALPAECEFSHQWSDDHAYLTGRMRFKPAPGKII